MSISPRRSRVWRTSPSISSTLEASATAISMAAENAAIEIAVADASSVADMEGLVRHTRERLGEIDILVYNTGTNVKDRALTRLTPAIWDMMISVNLNGAYYATLSLIHISEPTRRTP